MGSLFAVPVEKATDATVQVSGSSVMRMFHGVADTQVSLGHIVVIAFAFMFGMWLRKKPA